MPRTIASLLALASATTFLAACSASVTTTAPPATTSVTGVTPRGGATGVDPSTSVVVTFSAPMMAGMQQYMSLRVGSDTGALVPGIAMMSADHMTLTFTPSAPLAAHTMYAFHLGGGMMDAQGHDVDQGNCPQMGGVPATAAMMGAHMMGGMMTGGNGEMGTGWMGPNGMYGMVFVFTTQ